MLDNLINEFNRRNDLPKSDAEYIVNDDTQVGIEFAFIELQSEITRLRNHLDKFTQL